MSRKKKLCAFVIAVCFYSALDLIFGWTANYGNVYTEQLKWVSFYAGRFSTDWGIATWHPFAGGGQSIFSTVLSQLNPFSIDTLLSFFLSNLLPISDPVKINGIRLFLTQMVFAWGCQLYSRKWVPSLDAGAFVFLVSFFSITASSNVLPQATSALVFLPFLLEAVDHFTSSVKFLWSGWFRVWLFVLLILGLQFNQFTIQVLLLPLIYSIYLARDRKFSIPAPAVVVATALMLVSLAPAGFILIRSYQEGGIFRFTDLVSRTIHITNPLSVLVPYFKTPDLMYLEKHLNTSQYFGIFTLCFFIWAIFNLKDKLPRHFLKISAVYLLICSATVLAYPLLVLTPLIAVVAGLGFEGFMARPHRALDDIKISRVRNIGFFAVVAFAAMLAGLMIRDSTWSTIHQTALTSLVFIGLTGLYFLWISEAEIYPLRRRLAFLILALDLLCFNYIGRNAKSVLPKDLTQYHSADFLFSTKPASPRIKIQKSEGLDFISGKWELPLLRLKLSEPPKEGGAHFYGFLKIPPAPTLSTNPLFTPLFDVKVSWIERPAETLTPFWSQSCDACFRFGAGNIPYLFELRTPKSDSLEDIEGRRKDTLQITYRAPNLGMKPLVVRPDRFEFEVPSDPEPRSLSLNGRWNRFWKIEIEDKKIWLGDSPVDGARKFDLLSPAKAQLKVWYDARNIFAVIGVVYFLMLGLVVATIRSRR